MELLVKGFVVAMVLATGSIFWFYWKKANDVKKLVRNWRKNPTKMDLNLATTKQIIQELKGRAQPIILVLPEIPRASGEPIKAIQIHVLGIDAEHAITLLHSAGELLEQNKESDDE